MQDNSILEVIDPLLQGQLFQNSRLIDCCIAQCSSKTLYQILQKVLKEKRDLSSSDFGGLPCVQSIEGLKYVCQNCPNIESIFLKFSKYAWMPGILGALNNVFTNCNMISSISLIYINGLDNYMLQVIGQHCQNLQQFVIGNNKHQELVIEVSDKGLKSVFEGCRKLSKVGLLLLGFITDKSLQSLALKSGPRLEELSVHNCPRLTQNGFSHVFQRCPNIKKIGLVPSTAENKNQIGFQCMFDLAANMVNLQEIYISEELTNVGIIEDACLVPLALNSPQLTKLVLADVAIDDGALYQFATNCPKLESVWLDNCTMSDAGVMSLVQNCRELQHLHLGAVQPHGRYSLLRIEEPQAAGISDETIRYISQHCHSLKTLSLVGQELLTSITLMYLTNNRKLLNSLEHLKLEHLSGLSGMRCQDDMMIAMLRHCSALKELSLEGYKGNSAMVLSEVLPLIGHRLQNLDLRCCASHSEETCIAIADNCPHLTSLRFGYSKGLSTTGLTYLIQKQGGQLKDLDLYGVRCVNDDVVNSILKHCVNIQRLILGSRSPTYANEISICAQSELYHFQNSRKDLQISMECFQDIDAKASYRQHFQHWYS